MVYISARISLSLLQSPREVQDEQLLKGHEMYSTQRPAAWALRRPLAYDEEVQAKAR
jgi:hypothetical protein